MHNIIFNQCQLYLQSIVILYTLVGWPQDPPKMVETLKQIIIISGYIISYYYRWGCIRYTILYYTLKDVRNQRLLLLLNVVREIYTLFG